MADVDPLEGPPKARVDTGVAKRGVEFYDAETSREIRDTVDAEYAYYDKLSQPIREADEREARIVAYYEDLAARTPGWSAETLRDLDTDFDPLTRTVEADRTEVGIDRLMHSLEGDRELVRPPRRKSTPEEGI